jgi:hypothetical protein
MNKLDKAQRDAVRELMSSQRKYGFREACHMINNGIQQGYLVEGLIKYDVQRPLVRHPGHKDLEKELGLDDE